MSVRSPRSSKSTERDCSDSIRTTREWVDEWMEQKRRGPAASSTRERRVVQILAKAPGVLASDRRRRSVVLAEHVTGFWSEGWRSAFAKATADNLRVACQP